MIKKILLVMFLALVLVAPISLFAADGDVGVIEGGWLQMIEFLNSESFTKIWSSVSLVLVSLTPIVSKFLSKKALVKIEMFRAKLKAARQEAANWRSLAESYNLLRQNTDTKVDALLESLQLMVTGSNLALDYKEKITGTLDKAKALDLPEIKLPDSLPDLLPDEAEEDTAPIANTAPEASVSKWG